MIVVIIRQHESAILEPINKQSTKIWTNLYMWITRHNSINQVSGISRENVLIILGETYLHKAECVCVRPPTISYPEMLAWEIAFLGQQGSEMLIYYWCFRHFLNCWLGDSTFTFVSRSVCLSAVVGELRGKKFRGRRFSEIFSGFEYTKLTYNQFVFALVWWFLKIYC